MHVAASEAIASVSWIVKSSVVNWKSHVFLAINNRFVTFAVGNGDLVSVSEDAVNLAFGGISVLLLGCNNKWS